MRSIVFLPAGIIASGIYLLVASAFALPAGAIAVGMLAIAIVAAAGLTPRTETGR